MIKLRHFTIWWEILFQFQFDDGNIFQKSWATKVQHNTYSIIRLSKMIGYEKKLYTNWKIFRIMFLDVILQRLWMSNLYSTLYHQKIQRIWRNLCAQGVRPKILPQKSLHSFRNHCVRRQFTGPSTNANTI